MRVAVIQPPRPTAVSVATLRGSFRHSALGPPNAECGLVMRSEVGGRDSRTALQKSPLGASALLYWEHQVRDPLTLNQRRRIT